MEEKKKEEVEVVAITSVITKWPESADTNKNCSNGQNNSSGICGKLSNYNICGCYRGDAMDVSYFEVQFNRTLKKK